MPHVVEHSIPAELVSKGDRLIWRNREWTVESEETKVKYTTIHTQESLEPFRIPREQTVKVLREELTDLERWQQKLARWTLQVKYELAKMDEDYQAAFDKFNSEHRRWNGLAYHMVETMRAAETTRDIRAQLLNRLYQMDPLEPQGKDVMQEVLDRADDVDILQAMWQQCNRMRNDVWHSVGSGRSTNQISNALKDIEVQTQRAWVDRYSDWINDMRESRPND